MLDWVLSGETVGHRLTMTKGRSKGLDYSMGILSTSIIAFYGALISYGESL
jgi:hypothetical protein